MIGVDPEIVTAVTYSWSGTFLIRITSRRMKTGYFIATAQAHVMAIHRTLSKVSILPVGIGLPVSLCAAHIGRLINIRRQ